MVRPMGWLPKAGRRWLDLVGIVVALATIVGFALTSEYLLAWIAVGALALLVVSFALTARDAHQTLAARDDGQTHLLAKAIADGRAILGIEEHQALVVHWERWREETVEMLWADFGVAAVLGFADASERAFETSGQAVRSWLAAEVEYLERLRNERAAMAGGRTRQ